MAGNGNGIDNFSDVLRSHDDADRVTVHSGMTALNAAMAGSTIHGPRTVR